MCFSTMDPLKSTSLHFCRKRFLTSLGSSLNDETSSYFGYIFWSPFTILVMQLSTQAIVISSQNLWHLPPVRPWRHKWTTPLKGSTNEIPSIFFEKKTTNIQSIIISRTKKPFWSKVLSQRWNNLNDKNLGVKYSASYYVLLHSGVWQYFMFVVL